MCMAQPWRSEKPFRRDIVSTITSNSDNAKYVSGLAASGGNSCVRLQSGGGSAKRARTTESSRQQEMEECRMHIWQCL